MQVGPPSHGMHSSSPANVATSHPALRIRAWVTGKPSTAIHCFGAVAKNVQVQTSAIFELADGCLEEV